MDEARLKARMSTEVEVEREVEKRDAVAVAKPETPVTATAPAAAAAACRRGDSRDLGGCHGSSRGDEHNKQCRSR